MNNRQTILLLILILAIASFFRLWQLDSVPPGIYPDEAINANQAITEPGKIFYKENLGREGLYINLISASFSVFGISIWSFKIVSALIGILTVLGLYFLTKLLFYQWNENTSRSIALFAAFFMAVSFWHTNFSRIGFRAILVPFILVLSFYFLFRGFKTQKLWNFILGGALFGIGFHTYIGFRVAVLLLGTALLLWLFDFRKRNLQKKFFGFAFIFLIFALIAALPIGIYFLQNPNDFIGRAEGISIFAQPSPVKALGKSLIAHLAMFNFFGDYNQRHNVSGSPVLFWPVGLLFLIGFILSISKLQGSMDEKKYGPFLIYFFLLSWFFIMLLPGVLTYEGIPHSLRCIGAIPAVFIFTGIGANFLLEKTKKIIGKSNRLLFRKALALSLILLTLSFIFVQFNKYFISWGKNPETFNAFSYNCVAIGKYLNSLPRETEKYVIINEQGPNLPLPVQTIIFIQRTENKHQNTNYIFPWQINEIKTGGKEISIVLMDKDENLLSEIRTEFPQGEIIKNNEFWAYLIYE